MIKVDDYLTHWKVNYGHVLVPDSEITDAMRADACSVVDRANQLLAAFGQARSITSGWRPVSVNRCVRGASVHSNHCVCRAIDLADGDGALDDWCVRHLDVLERLGLWLESPDSTRGWCHIQIVPPRSGNRVFKP